MRVSRWLCLTTGMLWLMAAADAFSAEKEGRSPVDELPPHIRRVTWFGERADWSHDGKRILFLAKTFGDVYEVELATGIIRPVTHHYFHAGYTRALYLANGDILLSGRQDVRPQESLEEPARGQRRAVGAQEGPERPAGALGEKLLGRAGRLAPQDADRLDAAQRLPHGRGGLRGRQAEALRPQEDPGRQGTALQVQPGDAELPPARGKGADLQRLRLPGHRGDGR